MKSEEKEVFQIYFDYNCLSVFVCKNCAKSNSYTSFRKKIKDTKRLHQLERGDIHPKSPKKLCNCVVNYTNNYYISYIVLCINSNGYMLHCGSAWGGELIELKDGEITYSLRDCRKSPKMAILAISHVMKSTGYEHQNHKFRVFRQSLP